MTPHIYRLATLRARATIAVSAAATSGDDHDLANALYVQRLVRSCQAIARGTDPLDVHPHGWDLTLPENRDYYQGVTT